MAQNNMTKGLDQTVRQGYEAMRQYTDKTAELAGNVSSKLCNFMRREPLIRTITDFPFSGLDTFTRVPIEACIL